MDLIEDPTGVVAAYVQAVWDKDAAALLSLYAEDMMSYDMWQDWSVPGKDAWRAAVAEWFGGLGDESVRVGFVHEKAEVAGDMALLCSAITYAALGAVGTKLRSLTNRHSWVLRKEPTGWRVIHEHGSVPIGFADLKGIMAGPRS